MSEDQASRVLDRFSKEVTAAARAAASTFGVEEDDARQEASILVATYAGLMPGRHEGALQKAEADAGGDEQRLKAIISKKLRLDLMQLFGRQVGADLLDEAVSLDALPLTKHPTYEFEDRLIDRVDRERELRREYPYLSMIAFDDMTEMEISSKMGTPYRTVKYRVAAERAKAAGDADLMEELNRELVSA